MKDIFRDSSKLWITWSIILASDSYWMLEILVTSCSGGWPSASPLGLHDKARLLPCHAGQGGGCTRSTIWVDYASENRVPQSEYNSKDNKNTMQVYLVTVMTHVIALEAGPSSQGALKPITSVQLITNNKRYIVILLLTCICHPACIVPPVLGDRDIKANIPPPPPASNAQQCEGCYLWMSCLLC